MVRSRRGRAGAWPGSGCRSLPNEESAGSPLRLRRRPLSAPARMVVRRHAACPTSLRVRGGARPPRSSCPLLRSLPCRFRRRRRTEITLVRNTGQTTTSAGAEAQSAALFSAVTQPPAPSLPPAVRARTLRSRVVTMNLEQVQAGHTKDAASSTRSSSPAPAPGTTPDLESVRRCGRHGQGGADRADLFGRLFRSGPLGRRAAWHPDTGGQRGDRRPARCGYRRRRIRSGRWVMACMPSARSKSRRSTVGWMHPMRRPTTRTDDVFTSSATLVATPALSQTGHDHR